MAKTASKGKNVAGIQFGVSGGSDIKTAGSSGKAIKDDLEAIAAAIHPKVTFNIDKDAIKSELQSALDDIKTLSVNVSGKLVNQQEIQNQVREALKLSNMRLPQVPVVQSQPTQRAPEPVVKVEASQNTALQQTAEASQRISDNMQKAAAASKSITFEESLQGMPFYKDFEALMQFRDAVFAAAPEIKEQIAEIRNTLQEDIADSSYGVSDLLDADDVADLVDDLSVSLDDALDAVPDRLLSAQGRIADDMESNMFDLDAEVVLTNTPQEIAAIFADRYGVELPVTPEVESGAVEAAIQTSTSSDPVDIPVEPVVVDRVDRPVDTTVSMSVPSDSMRELSEPVSVYISVDEASLLEEREKIVTSLGAPVDIDVKAALNDQQDITPTAETNKIVVSADEASLEAVKTSIDGVFAPKTMQFHLDDTSIAEAKDALAPIFEQRNLDVAIAWKAEGNDAYLESITQALNAEQQYRETSPLTTAFGEHKAKLAELIELLKQYSNTLSEELNSDALKAVTEIMKQQADAAAEYKQQRIEIVNQQKHQLALDRQLLSAEEKLQQLAQKQAEDEAKKEEEKKKKQAEAEAQKAEAKNRAAYKAVLDTWKKYGNLVISPDLDQTKQQQLIGLLTTMRDILMQVNGAEPLDKNFKFSPEAIKSLEQGTLAMEAFVNAGGRGSFLKNLGTSDLTALTQSLAGFYANNKRAIDGNSGLRSAYEKLFTDINGGVYTTKREATAAINAFQIQVKSTGNVLMETLDRFASTFTGKLMSTISYGAISLVRRGASELVVAVRDVDAAMVQLRIVTGATDSEMEQFFAKSADLSKELGKSISDVMGSIEVFSRLGYGLADATELAKYANILSNVGAVDVEAATTGLTSIIKSFGLQVSESEHVADVLIQVGQKYAISAAELMEAFERGGAALGATGMSFEKSAAIFAAANASIQNAEKAGTAIQTVAARIRGAKSELEELGADYEDVAEGISKYRDELKALTNVNGSGGFDIMQNADLGTYKDIYDIFVGISKVWGDLSDASQARIAEILGGTRQLSVISSILTNIADAEGALATARDSAGVAMAAEETYMNSIEGMLGKISARWQEFSTSVVDSNVVITLLKGADAMLGFANAIAKANALLPVTASLLGAIFTLLNHRKVKVAVDGFISSIVLANFNIATETELTGSLSLAFSVLSKQQQKATIATLQHKKANDVLIASMRGMMAGGNGVVTSLGAIVKANPIGVAMTVVTTLISVVQLVKSTIPTLDDLRGELDETRSTLDTLNGTLDENIARIVELNDIKSGKDTSQKWSQELQDELDVLEKQNEQLRLNIEYQKSIQAAQQAKVSEKSVKEAERQGWAPTDGRASIFQTAFENTTSAREKAYADFAAGRIDAQTFAAQLDDLNNGVETTKTELADDLADFQKVVDELPDGSEFKKEWQQIIDDYKEKVVGWAASAPGVVDGLSEAVATAISASIMTSDAADKALTDAQNALEYASANGASPEEKAALEAAIDEAKAAFDAAQEPRYDETVLSTWAENAKQTADGLISQYSELEQQLATAAAAYDTLVNGNVKYENRPFVSPDSMVAAGWSDFDGDIATTFTQGVTIGESGAEFSINVTPILENGEVLSPEALDRYLQTLVTDRGVNGLLASDRLNLVVDVRPGVVDAAEWEDAFNEVELGDIKAVHTELHNQLSSTQGEIEQYGQDVDAYIASLTAQEIEIASRLLAHGALSFDELKAQVEDAKIALSTLPDEITKVGEAAQQFDAGALSVGEYNTQLQRLYELYTVLFNAGYITDPTILTSLKLELDRSASVENARAAVLAAAEKSFGGDEGSASSAVMSFMESFGFPEFEEWISQMTAQEYAEFIKYLEDTGVQADTLFEDMRAEIEKTAEDADNLGQALSFTQLDDAKKKFSALGKAISDIKSNKSVTYSTLSGIAEAFSDVEGVDIQSYIERIAANSGDIEVVTSAITDMAEACVIAKLDVDDLAESNANLISSMLKEVGVVNSDVIAHQMVVKAKLSHASKTKTLVDADGNLNQALVDETNSFFEAAGAANQASLALELFKIQAMLTSDNPIDMSGGIASLSALAHQCGITGAALGALVSAAGKLSTLNANIQSYSATLMKSTSPNEIATYQGYITDAQSAVTNIIQGAFNDMFAKVPTISPAGGGGGGGAKSVEDEMKSAFDEAKSYYDYLIKAEEHSNDDLEKKIGYYREIQKVAKKTEEEYRKMGYDETSEYVRAMKEAIMEANDAIIELRKAAGEQQHDALETILDAAKDLVKFEHDQEIEVLEDELDTYKEIINKKKELLDLTKDEEDHEESVAEKVKEIAKLQSRIDQLSLDDSREARATRKQLEEELYDLQKELSDEQKDYALEQQKTALDEEYDAHEKANKDEIELKKKELDSEEELYQAAIKRIGNNWDGFYKDLFKWNKEYGNMISDDLSKSWDTARAALEKYGSVAEALKNTAPEALEKAAKAENSTFEQSLSAPTAAGSESGSATGGTQQAYEAAYQYINTHSGYVGQKRIDYAKEQGLDPDLFQQYINWVLIKKRQGTSPVANLPAYHTGGVVGKNGTDEQDEILALLQNGEMVLDKRKQNTLAQIIDVAKLFSERLMQPVNVDIDAVMRRVSSRAKDYDVGDRSSMVFNPEIHVEINHNGTMSDDDAQRYGSTIADTVVDKLNEAFSKRGLANRGSALLKA